MMSQYLELAPGNPSIMDYVLEYRGKHSMSVELHFSQYLLLLFLEQIWCLFKIICDQYHISVCQYSVTRKVHMGQVTKLWLSYYLVLLSIDSKLIAKPGNKTAKVSLPDPYKKI